MRFLPEQLEKAAAALCWGPEALRDHLEEHEGLHAALAANVSGNEAERAHAEARITALTHERDRFRAALEKCQEAVDLGADPRPLSVSVVDYVQTMARTLKKTNATIDALLPVNAWASSPRLDRLRFAIERLVSSAKENAEAYTGEVKLKRTAQQERDKALGYVETHRLERNAARDRLETLARLATQVRKTGVMVVEELGADCLAWLRNGVPSAAVPPAAPAAVPPAAPSPNPLRSPGNQLSNALYNIAQGTPHWDRCRELITEWDSAVRGVK